MLTRRTVSRNEMAQCERVSLVAVISRVRSALHMNYRYRTSLICIIRISREGTIPGFAFSPPRRPPHRAFHAVRRRRASSNRNSGRAKLGEDGEPFIEVDIARSVAVDKYEEARQRVLVKRALRKELEDGAELRT